MNYWRAELREWLAGCGATDSERLVFLVLALHANGNRVASPGVPTIAAETGLHRATVFRALGELVAGGALVADPTFGQRTAYRIDTDPSHCATRLTVRPVAERAKTRRSRPQNPSHSATQKGIEGIEGTVFTENGSESVSDRLPVETVELGFAGVENGRTALERARHGARGQ